MKKIASFIFLLIASLTVAHAQNFQFKYHGVAVEEGATVTIAAEQDAFGDLSCETNPSDNPSNGLILEGTNNAYVGGTAHLEIMEHTFKAKTIQWCMGGACVPLKNVKEYDKEFEGTTVLTQFDAYTIRQQGYLVAKLSCTVGSQTTTIYIEFTNGASGIRSLNALDNRADVYDLNGRLVMRDSDITMRQSLHQGVYIFKSGDHVRKVMVK